MQARRALQNRPLTRLLRLRRALYTSPSTPSLQVKLARAASLNSKIIQLRQHINPNLNLLVRDKLRYMWTYHSNSLEGNSLTLEETTFFLRERLTIHGKRFTEFLQDDRDESLEPQLQTLCDSIAEMDRDDSVSPIVRAALAHYNLVHRHPFQTRNRQLGRILMNKILMNRHYPPAIIKDSQRTDYLWQHHRASGEHLDPFIEFVADATLETQETVMNVIRKHTQSSDDLMENNSWRTRA